MTPERWQQVKEIFNAAINYRPAERRVFLSKICSGDEDLRSEVESLIKSHEKTGEFIDAPVYQEAMELFPDEKPELRPGQMIASYEVVSFLSKGGMGEVYLAQDHRLGRKVALKLLPATFTKDAQRLRRFEQEARAASALNHPNIITIYEIREAESTLLIATEFVEGKTLRQRLALGALDLSEALHIAIQIADALAAAHSAGVIHRDIKPENVMIRPDGYVKVLDFGLAKLAEPALPASHAEVPTRKVKTGSGVILGTVGYMSPEQARGITVDARSDIFNLGAVIYELVAGRKPFTGETTSDVFASILKTDPPPLTHFTPEAPAELVRIVNKALRKDREERYQVVKDLLLDLKSLREELAFQAKLDRSVAPDKNVEIPDASGTEGPVTAEVRSDTNEIRNAVSTITHSLSVQMKRHLKVAILAVTALALMMIASSIALYKIVNRPRPEIAEAPQVLKTTQITFSAGVDGFPSLSPDGNSFAYSSDQNGRFEIYVRQLTSGGGELQLTNDGDQNFHPSWSPDGQRIAFYSKKRGGIWLVSALGGSPKQVVEFGSRPSWSPDGSLIAFQSGYSSEFYSGKAMPPSAIWIVPSQGGSPRQLTQPGNPPGGHSSASWSPDGKRIAFEASDYIFDSVWSVAVAGGEPKKIAAGNEPIYAPDGKHIYLVGQRVLLQVQVSAAGEPIGQPLAVVGSPPNLVNASFSKDGKKIVYGGSRVQSNLWKVSLSPSSSAPVGLPSVFSLDTSQRNNLVSFSPDGRKLALNRWRPGTSADIWVADADGRNLTQLTNDPATDSQPNWFPGGDRLAFLSNRGNKRMMLWTISIATGKEELFMDLGEGVQFAELSPDGQQVAINLIQNGAMNIWVSSRDGQRRQLTFDNELMGFPCWSPDGKLIAFEMKRGPDDHLMVVSSSGGPPIQLTFDHGKSWPHDWSPDGDKIAFAGQRDGVWNIYWYSLSTKAQRQLTNNTKVTTIVRYPAWSPLGNQIVYEYAETMSNIWLLELK